MLCPEKLGSSVQIDESKMREANSPWEGNAFTAAMKLRFHQGNLPILFLFHMFNPAELVTSFRGHVLLTSSTSGYLSHIPAGYHSTEYIQLPPLVTSRKVSSWFLSRALTCGQRPAEGNAGQDRDCQT